ncbi:hypothetical protein, conserved in T. vivax [Trypanosoma vivax Y486]|uniref:Uncharacterized protein n=1 Tax=Trypanosoma vivax (strain Y486) TaxID=1055687 RepID=F9WPX7_TRYVY|nr:hypothetical protein, conserved in T. vivax [Trypanosoma vivax Y486]|eukprot:CCD19604.1 hypothetical protein, conserved in T. vivax [Trypanosoma vivax Y486]
MHTLPRTHTHCVCLCVCESESESESESETVRTRAHTYMVAYPRGAAHQRHHPVGEELTAVHSHCAALTSTDTGCSPYTSACPPSPEDSLGTHRCPRVRCEAGNNTAS